MLNLPPSKQDLNNPSTSSNSHSPLIKASDHLRHFLSLFNKMYNLRPDGQQTSGNHTWAQLKISLCVSTNSDLKRLRCGPML